MKLIFTNNLEFDGEFYKVYRVDWDATKDRTAGHTWQLHGTREILHVGTSDENRARLVFRLKQESGVPHGAIGPMHPDDAKFGQMVTEENGDLVISSDVPPKKFGAGMVHTSFSTDDFRVEPGGLPVPDFVNTDIFITKITWESTPDKLRAV